MRLLSLPALFLAALLSPACLPRIDDTLPPQRPWPLAVTPACPAGDLLASSIDGLLPADPSSPWRWTTPAVEVRFPAPGFQPAAVSLRCFVSGDIRRAVGDQSLRLAVNGQPAGSRRLLGEGEKTPEWPVPPGSIQPDKPVVLRVEVSPSFPAPDGARLGVLLHSVRLLRGPQ
jgi:hypothetical protein